VPTVWGFDADSMESLSGKIEIRSAHGGPMSTRLRPAAAAALFGTALGSAAPKR
jgi:hypothetical protein